MRTWVFLFGGNILGSGGSLTVGGGGCRGVEGGSDGSVGVGFY